MASPISDELAFVVMSDLHLGERNGVFTDAREGGGVVANGAMDGLGQALATLARGLGGSRPPSVVLNGDCVELALAPRHVAIDAFDQFLSRVMPPGHPFAPDLGWLPGNHDHTLWPGAREALDVELLYHSHNGPIPAAPTATALFAGLGAPPGVDVPAAARSPLLTGVMRSRHPHLTGSVHVLYPNLALLEGDRVVVLHHGHLADRFCTLMTPLGTRLSGGAKERVMPADIEADNGAWINFLWSSLGQEGRSGSTLKRIYDLMQTETSRVILGNEVARSIVGDHPGPLGRVGGSMVRRAVVLATMATQGVGQARLVEDPQPQDDQRLLEYLAGPVAAQLRAERSARDLQHINRFGFLFGHTHQPFCSAITGRGVTVDAVNTGGWVVDTDQPRPRVGGAIALISRNLDIALVRVIQQLDDPARSTLRVQAPPGSSPAFAETVRDCIADHPDVWRSFRTELTDSILRRRAELAADIAREREVLQQSGLRTTTLDRQVAQAQRWAAKRFARGNQQRSSIETPPPGTDLVVPNAEPDQPMRHQSLTER